jgi:hypothetical protein
VKWLNCKLGFVKKSRLQGEEEGAGSRGAGIEDKILLNSLRA